jgi:hypothetical protein
MAPLFGSVFGQSGTTSGNAQASTPGGNTANAPKGTAALSESVPAAPATVSGGIDLTSYLPWIAVGAFFLLAAGFLLHLVKK